jgi:6-phosphogluconolactonase
MKAKPIGRALSASVLSFALALGATSCSNDYTVAYVYMTTAKTLPHGLINAFQVDYQSGFLYVLPDSPIDAGGRNTVGLVVAPNNLFLYTVNRDDSDVVEFAIGTDGKLYGQNTYKVNGSFATAAALDASGKFLYVTFTYQSTASGQQLYTPGNPGPGGVSIFPVNADNSLGTPTTINVGRNPVGIATSKAGNFVYVIDQDSETTANLLGFAENPQTGALTPLPGVTINSGNVVSTGFQAGTTPGGIAEDPTGTHLYVADQAANQIIAYTVAPSGVPTIAGTAPTEAGPSGMTFDLSNPAKYLYVVNSFANTIDGFTFGANGVPVRSSTAASTGTGSGPTCISMIGAPSDQNPHHGIYMYTSNSLSNNITGEQVNPNDGSLEQIMGTPFGGSALPSCIAAVQAYPIRIR